VLLLRTDPGQGILVDALIAVAAYRRPVLAGLICDESPRSAVKAHSGLLIEFAPREECATGTQTASWSAAKGPTVFTSTGMKQHHPHDEQKTIANFTSVKFYVLFLYMSGLANSISPME
jgi:hypothetical protein